MTKYALAILSFLTMLFAVNHPVQADSPKDLITQGKVFGELRYRYEEVEQSGSAHSAQANTLRTVIGFETGTYKDFKAVISGLAVSHLFNSDYNDTTNGKAAYPVIADPRNLQIHQAWVQWTGLPSSTIKAGQQALNLDNQRFIGSVNFRQTEQTFDGVELTTSPIERLTFSYNYIWTVNRIFGENSAAPDYTGHNHLFHAAYAFADWLHLTAYDYMLDIHQAPALSSDTIGAQISGIYETDSSWKIKYLAEYATQSDGRRNPAHYRADYYHLSPSVTLHAFTMQAGYEALHGNGTSTFQTPYATLHKFNGWADKFLTTPVNGLEDIYGGLSYKIHDFQPWANGTILDATYHDFNATHASMNYGRELDLQIAKTFHIENYHLKTVNLSASYADYTAQQLFTNTRKLWLGLDIKF